MAILPQSGSKVVDRFFQIALLNLALFMIVAALMGGDAVNGEVKDGQYYVGEHGKLTKVTRVVFIYSEVHTYSVFATFPLALVVFLVTYSSNSADRKR